MAGRLRAGKVLHKTAAHQVHSVARSARLVRLLPALFWY
jgi:hypothetical protein